LPLVQRRPAFERMPLHDPMNGAARDGGRLWGGSFSDVSSHEMTRLPSSITFWRRCDRCNRSRHARRRSSHIERLRLDFVPSVRVMHRRVLCRRGVPLRGVPDIHGLAGRSAVPPSFHFSPGGAPGFFCALRRFVPANGWTGISALPGPHVASTPRVRPDLFSSG